MSCPDCFKGGISQSTTEPAGKIETVYGRKTYVALPPSSTPASNSTILIITDAFGLSLVNNKLIADEYAAGTGCKVLVPDLFPTGPAPLAVMGYFEAVTEPVQWWDIIGQLHRLAAVFKVLFTFVPFILRNSVQKAAPGILKFARAMKADLGTTTGGKLGVAGFCWGGYGSTFLCKETAVEGGSERLIDAEFCAHPSFIDKKMVLEALQTFHVPYAMAIGNKDMAMGIATVEDIQGATRQEVGLPEENDYEIVVYPDCTHGFAARPKPDSEIEAKGAEKAKTQAIEWFNRYL